MADVYETRTFDEIVSTSLDLYTSQLEDNVFSENPTTWALKQAGFYEAADGGIQIIEPLMYGDNETVQSYAGYDTLDLSPQEGITAAVYPWTQVAGSVVISGMQEFQNAGKGKLVDLISAKIMQLEQSLQAKFTSYIYGAGKYNAAQTSKDPAGLLAFVSEASDTYDPGGVDTSVCTWWQNKVLDNEGTALTWVDGAALATGPSKMSQAFHCGSKKTGGAPSIILATQKGFEVYANYLRGKQSIDTLSDMDAVAAGFENLKFRGMTLFWDSAYRSLTVTSETLNGTTVSFMMLNPKFMKMRYASGVNFKRTPWITPANQDARSCLVLWYGNMTCSKRCKQVIMTDANITEIL